MNEAHGRFHDWLTSGAEGDPPRDLAVHASVCDGCRQSIAAFDRLASINPELAGMPAEPTGSERGRLALAGQVLAATAVLFCAGILGVGASQLIGVQRHGGPVAHASPTPNQNVLGQTATPQPSAGASGQETLTPLGTPIPTAQAHPGPTPVPRRTPAPTPIPTAAQTPSTSASGLPSPTPTPSDTATPTPVPTVPAQITDLVASQGPFPGEIDLSWSAPADGGSQIQTYTLCRGLAPGAEDTCVTIGSPGYADAGLATDVQYWYTVVATNEVGSGPSSNEGTAIAP